MKILYVNALYSPYVAGGAEISLKLIVEGMRARGHEVAVLSLAPDGGMHSDRVAGITVYRTGLKNDYWPFAEAKPGRYQRLVWHLRDRYNTLIRADVRKVLQLEQPDVVSCHNLVGWSIALWDEVRRAGIPIVQVLHDMYLLCANSNMYRNGQVCAGQCFRCRVLRSGYRRASQKVSAVVGISSSILDRFIMSGYFYGIPKHVVYNARHIPAPLERHRREPGAPLKIGYLGTLSSIKGVAWLIDQFQKSGVVGGLSIAGRGQAENVQQLKALANGDPRIVFEGYVDSSSFYSGIDVLVVPSLWEEPLGMVAVEALANHLPVIASNRGGLRETVIARQNGLFCDPDNPDSLGEALKMLWQDTALYDRLAGNARQSMSVWLDTDRMIREYERVLQTVTTIDDHV